MKTIHTDEQLQIAVNAALHKVNTSSGSRVSEFHYPNTFPLEAPDRLIFARALLACLPEPTPPVVDGKTPGQVDYEAFVPRGPGDWESCVCKQSYERSASAVLAAFGGQNSLEAAIKRMDAVPMIELETAHGLTLASKRLNAVRARLIAAAREGPAESQPLPITTLAQDQVQATPTVQAAAEVVLNEEVFGKPAEIPWTEWYGGECPLKDEEVKVFEYKLVGNKIGSDALPSELKWFHSKGSRANIIAYRVLKWRDGFGPQTEPDWKAKYEALETERGIASRAVDNILRILPELNESESWEDSASAIRHHIDKIKARAENAEAELALVTEERNKLDKQQAEVVLAAMETGWNGVENSKLLTNFIRDLAAKLERVTLERNHAVNTEKLAHLKAKFSQLRPLSEAGDVPEGCMRVTGYNHDGDSWSLGANKVSGDTHFADIRLPAVEADPYAELKAAHAEGKVIQWHIGHMWHDLSYSENPLWIHPAKDYRIKPADTFTAQGKTWTRHTKGDAMPCDGEKFVELIRGDEVLDGRIVGSNWFWNDVTITGWRYADEPTPPKLIPLDINDIRATDEFKYKEGQVIQSVVSWNNNNVELPRDGVIDFKELVADYLRRQHGSNEWKPCTKDETK